MCIYACLCKAPHMSYLCSALLWFERRGLDIIPKSLPVDAPVAPDHVLVSADHHPCSSTLLGDGVSVSLAQGYGGETLVLRLREPWPSYLSPGADLQHSSHCQEDRGSNLALDSAPAQRRGKGSPSQNGSQTARLAATASTPPSSPPRPGPPPFPRPRPATSKGDGRARAIPPRRPS